jgi:hypothetical protein
VVMSPSLIALLCFDAGIPRRSSSNLIVRRELVTPVNRQGTTLPDQETRRAIISTAMGAKC